MHTNFLNSAHLRGLGTKIFLAQLVPYSGGKQTSKFQTLSWSHWQVTQSQKFLIPIENELETCWGKTNYPQYKVNGAPSTLN